MHPEQRREPTSVFRGEDVLPTTLMLGHTFASLRGDRVIALDGNPDAGSLAYRVRRETSNTITGLLASESVGWGDVCEPGVARFQRTARARHKHTY